jgi:hypothetical protein
VTLPVDRPDPVCSGWVKRKSLEHRAEKWMPVFGKNDATTKIYSIGSDSEIGSDAVERGTSLGLYDAREWQTQKSSAI